MSDLYELAREHLTKARGGGWSEELHPRDPATGRFVENVGGGGLSYTGLTRVNSRTFGRDLIADVQSIDVKNRTARVRVHLEDDHPAVRDAQADNPNMHSDQFEWIDDVPLQSVRDARSDVPLERPARRAAARLEQVQAARVRQAERERNMERYRQGKRMSIPELDAGLRTKKPPA